MRSEDAADRLREMVVEAGVDPVRPSLEDVDRTWEVFRRFALDPADDVASEAGEYGDGILAQYGVYDWSESQQNEFFELDMTRQFAVPAPGQPDLRQVNCTFRFTPTDQLRALGEDSLWSFEMVLDAFFEQALAMHGFAGTRNSGETPVELDIGWTDV
jgi:hypothetical protein